MKIRPILNQLGIFALLSGGGYTAAHLVGLAGASRDAESKQGDEGAADFSEDDEENEDGEDGEFEDFDEGFTSVCVGDGDLE